MRHAESILNAKMKIWKDNCGYKHGRSQITKILASEDAGEEEKKHAGEAQQNYSDMIFNVVNKDAVLSDKGKQQCDQQRELVRSLNFTHILVSPMRRAVETALRVASNYLIVREELEEGENQPDN